MNDGKDDCVRGIKTGEFVDCYVVFDGVGDYVGEKHIVRMMFIKLL
jgi:hypothetical protein